MVDGSMHKPRNKKFRRNTIVPRVPLGLVVLLPLLVVVPQFQGFAIHGGIIIKNLGGVSLHSMSILRQGPIKRGGMFIPTTFGPFPSKSTPGTNSGNHGRNSYSGMCIRIGIDTILAKEQQFRTIFNFFAPDVASRCRCQCHVPCYKICSY
eukprot:2852725-Rhodomonas_salina.1